MQQDEVVQAILLAGRHVEAPGIVLGLVSVRRGEGVTYVGERLAERLADPNGAHTLFLPSHVALARMDVLDNAISRADRREGLCVVSSGDERFDRRPLPPPGRDDLLFTNLTALTGQFRHVIVDCGDLESSGDGLMLARAVTAMLLVVEADRTNRADVVRAQQMIERAGGKLLGCILNKRRYPIPDSVYQLLWGRS